MLFSSLVASTFLVASTLVQASPTVSRYDDSWSAGFLKELGDHGLTTYRDILEEFFKTKEGPDLIEELKCQKLSHLAPKNSVRPLNHALALSARDCAFLLGL